MRRHELSDAQRELIADLAPRLGRCGGGSLAGPPAGGERADVEPCTEARWRDLPERHGPWQTVRKRFSRWSREGLSDRLPDRLRLKPNAEGLIDLDLRCTYRAGDDEDAATGSQRWFLHGVFG